MCQEPLTVATPSPTPRRKGCDPLSSLRGSVGRTRGCRPYPSPTDHGESPRITVTPTGTRVPSLGTTGDGDTPASALVGRLRLERGIFRVSLVGRNCQGPRRRRREGGERRKETEGSSFDDDLLVLFWRQ